ncbi:MAG TPA: LysM peptidoglycan-binding domain-containing protein, partial [Anaerolineales bacterium]
WIQARVAAARQNFNVQMQQVELATKYRNAQELILSSRTGEARALLNEIQATKPDYPGLQPALAQLEKIDSLEKDYSEAMRLVGQADYQGALAALQKVEAQDPYYKDVALQITDIRRQFLFGDLLAQADAKYNAKDWEGALAGYETVRALDSQYQAETVEERLFNSYMNAAQAVLASKADLDGLNKAENYFRRALALRPKDAEIQKKWAEARKTVEDRLVNSYLEMGQAVLANKADSLDALKTAEGYFYEALKLQPDNPDVKAQDDLARLYLKSQVDFVKGQWNDVITGLEQIYKNNPDYALGTSRQTLYEAYIARGDEFLASGQYDAALTDFQRATVLVDETPDSQIPLFQVQLKVADLQGVLGDFERAVRIYQSAFNLGGFNDLVKEQDPTFLSSKLTEAESYANWGNYKTSYRLYREIANKFAPKYQQLTHNFESGEYLTQLANRYHTTVEAILAANNIKSMNDIGAYSGKTIVIPVFPGDTTTNK